MLKPTKFFKNALILVAILLASIWFADSRGWLTVTPKGKKAVVDFLLLGKTLTNRALKSGHTIINKKINEKMLQEEVVKRSKQVAKKQLVKK